jgi:hypothetical protein
MNDTVRVSGLIEVQHVAPQLHRAQQSVFPEFGAGTAGIEVEHPQGDLRPRIEKSMTEQLSLGRADDDEIAGPRTRFDIAHELAKDMRMSSHRAERYGRERRAGYKFERPLLEKFRARLSRAR